jgi:hypothetical protein
MLSAAKHLAQRHTPKLRRAAMPKPGLRCFGLRPQHDIAATASLGWRPPQSGERIRHRPAFLGSPGFRCAASGLRHNATASGLRNDITANPHADSAGRGCDNPGVVP